MAAIWDAIYGFMGYWLDPHWLSFPAGVYVVLSYIFLNFVAKALADWAGSSNKRDERRDTMWSDLHKQSMEMAKANSDALLQVSCMQAASTANLSAHLDADEKMFELLEKRLDTLEAMIAAIDGRLNYDNATILRPDAIDDANPESNQ